MTNVRRKPVVTPAEQNRIAFKAIGYIPDGTTISYMDGTKEVVDKTWGVPYEHETGGWVVRVHNNRSISVNLHEVCVPGQYNPPYKRGVMLLPDSGGDFGSWRINNRIWSVTCWQRHIGEQFWSRQWRTKRSNRSAAIHLGWDLKNSVYWWKIFNFEGQLLDEGFEYTSRKAAALSCKKLRAWLNLKRQMSGGGA